MSNNFFILIISAVYLAPLPPAICYGASNGSLESYFTTGEKSQTDIIEERDLAGTFYYYRYGLSSGFNLDKNASVKTGFDGYHKNFSGAGVADLDSYTYKIGADFLLLDNEEASVDIGSDFSLRNKRYDNYPGSEYDQIKASGSIRYKLKDIYSLGISSGINNYEYINKSDKDILKTFLKISPEIYLFDKKLELGGSSRIQWLDAQGDNKDTTETVFSGNASLNLDMPLLYKLKGGIEAGKENAQDTEDREDFLRYKYTKWYAATYHKFDKKLKTQAEYGQKNRDYLVDINDYENWYIKDKTNFQLLENGLFDLDIFTDLEHKETDFDKISTKSYIKNEISGGLSFAKRAKWSLTPEFTFTDYNYGSESTSNEKSYKAKLSASKYIGDDVILEGYYWYKWKDYENRSDIEQWVLSLSCNIKF